MMQLELFTNEPLNATEIITAIQEKSPNYRIDGAFSEDCVCLKTHHPHGIVIDLKNGQREYGDKESFYSEFDHERMELENPFCTYAKYGTPHDLRLMLEALLTLRPELHIEANDGFIGSAKTFLTDSEETKRIEAESEDMNSMMDAMVERLESEGTPFCFRMDFHSAFLTWEAAKAALIENCKNYTIREEDERRIKLEAWSADTILLQSDFVGFFGTVGAAKRAIKALLTLDPHLSCESELLEFKGSGESFMKLDTISLERMHFDKI